MVHLLKIIMVSCQKET